MKKSPLRKIGKIGKANIEARKLIADIAQEANLTSCEIMLSNICAKNFGLAPAHKHERHWYKGDIQKLSSISEWVAACQPCHFHIDTHAKLKEEVFNKLRP